MEKVREMLVSIIIPIYNGADYLKECLDSVVRQDIEEKEIICIDDGSVDNSANIIKEYQKSYSNIRLIIQENQGSGIARNKGLDIAQGKYISFMDADDYYLDETALRKMIEVCETKKVSICGSFYTFLIQGEQKLQAIWRKELEGQTDAKKFQYTEYQYQFHYQNYIFERDFLNQNQLRFPDLRRFQDPPFFVQAMYLAKEFAVAPVELYCYRGREYPFVYSFVQINDLLQGVLMNLSFAKKKKLEILVKDCVDILNTYYKRDLIHTVAAGNMTALKRLMEIEQEIEASEIVEGNVSIAAIDEIKYILSKGRFLANPYQFPFHEIPSGSRIAVYGAGEAGKNIVSMIESVDYCSISAWVDKQYESYQKLGLSVEHPDCLIQKEFDYLLIAIEREYVFEEIRNELLQKKWAEGKIIVGPVKKLGKK